MSWRSRVWRGGARVSGCAIVLMAGVLLGACASGGGSGAAASGPSTTLRVTLTDTGCVPATLDAVAGHITFAVANNKSSKATSFNVRDEHGDSVASAYNVLGGLSHTVSADLRAGRYTMECEGGGAGGTGVLTIREPGVR